jgi:hypothetical protein
MGVDRGQGQREHVLCTSLVLSGYFDIHVENFVEFFV